MFVHIHYFTFLRYLSKTKPITMKKSIAILSLVVVFAMLAASCSHKTCPAYRGSIAENVVSE